MPAPIASSSCQARRKRPMVEAPAPSATNTVVKPSTKATEADDQRDARAAPRRLARCSSRKSSTVTPAM